MSFQECFYAGALVLFRLLKHLRKTNYENEGFIKRAPVKPILCLAVTSQH